MPTYRKTLLAIFVICRYCVPGGSAVRRTALLSALSGDTARGIKLYQQGNMAEAIAALKLAT